MSKRYFFASPLMIKSIELWATKDGKKKLAKAYNDMLDAWHDFLFSILDKL